MNKTQKAKMKTLKHKNEWKLNKKDFNFSIDPRDNFFHFVNGGWIKNNPIPKTETSWGTFYVLRKKNKIILHSLLKALIHKKNKTISNEARLTRALYSSGINIRKRNKDRIKDIEFLFKKIKSITNTDELATLIGEFHRIGISCFWGSFAEQDLNKSTRMMFWLFQDGLGLPEKDYYFPKNAKEKKILKQYFFHIRNIFILYGDNNSQAIQKADTVLKIEKQLALVSMNKEERYDYHKQNNRRTTETIRKTYKKINWPRYFTAIGIKNIKVLNLAQPDFFKQVDVMFGTVSLPLIKTYLEWCVLNSLSGALSEDFIAEDFDFYGKKLSGQTKQKHLWERILGVVEQNLGEALGKIYIKSYFTATAKKKTDILIDDIIDAYRFRLENNLWMSSVTKKKALKKLATIKKKIGYPSKWKGYKGLKLSSSNSYIENLFALSAFYHKRNLKKVGKKVNRTEWHFSPSTVNACYDPGLNDVTFPAGILQPPFFDELAPDAINYGAIGSVIGHELTHGFDDTGSHFDAYGNLKNWWTNEDRKKFEDRAKILVRQFGDAKLFEGLCVNGKLTLGENIADLGGILLALDAYKHFKKRNNIKDFKKQGFTDTQLFFIGYAITERGHTIRETERQRLITDPHSPSVFRVNIPLSNMKEFYDAFGVLNKSKLFREDKKLADIW